MDTKDKEIERLTIRLRKTEHQLDDALKMGEVINAENESLKAEVERLKEENKKMSAYIGNGWGYVSFLEFVKNQRAEVLKEAAKKFAGHSDYHGDTILCTLICMAEGKKVGNAKPLDKHTIDNLLNELVGDKK